MLKVAEVIQRFLDDGNYLIGQDVDPSGFAGMHHEVEGIVDTGNRIITMGVRENAAIHAAFGISFASSGKKKVIVEAQFADFAALMVDGMWNCGALCRAYGQSPNITIMTFRGPEEGSAEHSKSTRTLFPIMEGVTWLNGGKWSDQNNAAHKLSMCLNVPGLKVIEFDLVDSREDWEYKMGQCPHHSHETESHTHAPSATSEIDSMIESAKAQAKVAQNKSVTEGLAAMGISNSTPNKTLFIKHEDAIQTSLLKMTFNNTTLDIQADGKVVITSEGDMQLDYKDLMNAMKNAKSPNEYQKFSIEVLKMLDALGFDENNPESVKLYNEACKRLMDECKKTFIAKDKAYGSLIKDLSFKTITFEMLRKVSRIFNVVLLEQSDVNPESLEENLKDIAVTCVALVIKLRTGNLEDKFLSKFSNFFSEST